MIYVLLVVLVVVGLIGFGVFRAAIGLVHTLPEVQAEWLSVVDHGNQTVSTHERGRPGRIGARARLPRVEHSLNQLNINGFGQVGVKAGGERPSAIAFLPVPRRGDQEHRASKR